jgi:hypothetical protein
VSGQRPGTVRERLDSQQRQITRLRAELEEVKAQLRLFACQLGWDPAALEFPADDVP